MNRTTAILACWLAGAVLAAPAAAQQLVEGGGAVSGDGISYRLVATSKTSTLEKEMNAAAADGYRFVDMMGGETLGGSEVVAVMAKQGDDARSPEEYLLLATNKTSTMEKELQAAGARGYQYRGQSVAQTAFGGQEIVAVLGRDLVDHNRRYEYRLLATTRTKTMGKELNAVGAEGFHLVGLTVSKTQFGGKELVSILMRSDE